MTPRVPKTLFALIKEERIGLRNYPVYNDYLKMLEPDADEWNEIFERRLDFMQKSFNELSEENAKKVIQREINGHKNIPFFKNYIKKIKTQFSQYLK